MAIALNDNIETNAPKPSDSRYFNGLIPRASTAEVNINLVSSIRYVGLTVNIFGIEYRYKDGTTDLDLVIKSSGSGGPAITTGNGLPVDAPVAIGDEYLDLDTKTWYKASGLTVIDRIIL